MRQKADRGRGRDGGGQGLWGLMLLFGALYTAQGLTGSLVHTALPTILRDAGARLDQLGLLYLLFLPWALKFLWAPLLDRYGWRRLGWRRSWLLPCQLLLALAALAAALLQPAEQLTWLLVVLFLVALAAATQDIATDALAVEALPAGRRYLGGGAQVAGGYAGFVIGVGLWLPLYATLGWRDAMLALAAFLLLLALPAWFRRPDAAPQIERPRPSLRAALQRPALRWALLFVLVYQSGGRLGVAMLGPFLVDAGLSLETIGWIKGVGASAAGLLGSLCGVPLLRRWGATAALTRFAALHALLFLVLAGVAWAGQVPPLMVGALILAEATVFSLTFVALYTSMMGWCSPQQAGTDFALLQSLDAVLAIGAAVLAGLIGQAFGHFVNFTLAAVLLLLGALAAGRLDRGGLASSPLRSPA